MTIYANGHVNGLPVQHTMMVKRNATSIWEFLMAPMKEGGQL